MHIQSINQSKLNFNGSYCFKGPWSTAMREATEPLLKELANGNKKIVAKMSSKRVLFDGIHSFGQKIYKPVIIAQDENMTLMQKIKEKLGIISFPEEEITEHYHRAFRTEHLLKERLKTDEYNLKKFRRILDINF